MARWLAVSLLILPFLFAAAPSQAALIVYGISLSGAAESPPNASPGTGFATITIDTGADTMEVAVIFSGLLGADTASHIHCCTAIPGTGTAIVATVTPTFTGFPLGVTAGSYDHTYDLTLAGTYNSAFVTATGSVANAEAALLGGLASGQAYLNIHSTVVPGGEIRGFPQLEVPEPASFAVLTVGVLGLRWARRRAVAVS